MEKLGYVKLDDSFGVGDHRGRTLPYVSIDENGYGVLSPSGDVRYISNLSCKEVDKPDPLTERNDPIKPDHYHSGGIDVFTFIEANLSKEALIGYHQGSAIKYIIRAGKKEGNTARQEFLKAQPHLDKLKELAE